MFLARYLCPSYAAWVNRFQNKSVQASAFEKELWFNKTTNTYQNTLTQLNHFIKKKSTAHATPVLNRNSLNQGLSTGGPWTTGGLGRFDRLRQQLLV